MPSMSDAEYRHFVTAGTRTAKWAHTCRDDREGMLLVRITPVKVVSEDDVTGDQTPPTITTSGRR